MIKCTGDSNALGNAFIKNRDGDIKDMPDVKEDINRVQYDLDATMREVMDVKDDLSKLKKVQSEDYHFLFREITGTDNSVHNQNCRISDIEGILLRVIDRLDELLPKKKIDLEDYQYFREATNYDD